MEKIPEVSVIIPTMKGREKMLKKLLSTLPKDCEKIVVDDEDLLLAAKRNKGARKAKGKYLLFIDDDNYLKDSDHIAIMKRHFYSAKIGVVGMMACYDGKGERIADGGSKRYYLSGFTRGINTNADWWKIPKGIYEVDEVANAFMIPRHVFEEVGGFDEVNFPIDLDEADLCKRIKDACYQIVMNPRAVCYHNSQTYSPIPNFRRKKSAYFLSRNIILFQRKHLNALSFGVFVVFFLPIRFCFYLFALVWNKNIQMILPMMKGYWDGLLCRRKNKYQQKKP